MLEADKNGGLLFSRQKCDQLVAEIEWEAVKALDRAMPLEPPGGGTPVPDTDSELGEREKEILQALLLLKAVGKRTRVSRQNVAKRVRPGLKASTAGHAISSLVKRGPVDSLRGQTGGVWLTPEGGFHKREICTPHVERHNLSIRTFLKRFTRLVLGFSKKLENLSAAVALYVAHYNFCRMHRSLPGTPAMAAKVAGHPWSREELFDAV
jgi:hypothetical protein